MYELAFILIGQLLGVVIALFVFRYSKYRDVVEASKTAHELTGLAIEELRRAGDRARDFEALFETDIEKFVGATLPYPALPDELTAQLLRSPFAVRLPDYLLKHIIVAHGAVRRFNDLYYQTYFELSYRRPGIIAEEKSIWADQQNEVEFKLSETYRERIRHVKDALHSSCQTIRSTVSDALRLGRGYESTLPSFWQFLLGKNH